MASNRVLRSRSFSFCKDPHRPSSPGRCRAQVDLLGHAERDELVDVVSQVHDMAGCLQPPWSEFDGSRVHREGSLRMVYLGV